MFYFYLTIVSIIKITTNYRFYFFLILCLVENAAIVLVLLLDLVLQFVKITKIIAFFQARITLVFLPLLDKVDLMHYFMEFNH